MCLLGGAVLLFVAWYDISGTADVYKQLPYLVSAGFTALALIVIGSALIIAGRGDRIDRRLAQLLDAITEAAQPAVLQTEPTEPTPPTLAPSQPSDSENIFLTVADGRTYHRPDCLLLRGKAASPATPADIESGALSPCPVCGPGSSP